MKSFLEPSVSLEFDSYFFFLRKFHYIAMDREAQLKLTDQGERVVDGDYTDKFSGEVGEFFADQILGSEGESQATVIETVSSMRPPPPPATNLLTGEHEAVATAPPPPPPASPPPAAPAVAARQTSASRRRADGADDRPRPMTFFARPRDPAQPRLRTPSSMTATIPLTAVEHLLPAA